MGGASAVTSTPANPVSAAVSTDGCINNLAQEILEPTVNRSNRTIEKDLLGSSSGPNIRRTGLNAAEHRPNHTFNQRWYNRKEQKSRGSD